MSNSNNFQPNVNTFVKSDDLRRTVRKKLLDLFFQISGSLQCKVTHYFFEVVLAVTSPLFS